MLIDISINIITTIPMNIPIHGALGAHAIDSIIQHGTTMLGQATSAHANAAPARKGSLDRQKRCVYAVLVIFWSHFWCVKPASDELILVVYCVVSYSVEVA